MRLKTLDMFGFKSFSEKTTVTFQPGVTAVVGPNGCGKSNISDAIRWVLGEQSAKHLRGDKMEDVIFSGTETRKPLGMAEVSLTITDIADQLPSEFGQYKEIEITRRLYRSGETDYSINKIPCRLKDIRDLMMDAGVGAKAHAIIEQDRVDKILSSKPQDRRFLFEEVAGVMKYKARRQECLSKLESTRQNQLRINDIIAEVKRQVNSLDRQAKKAERYQKLRTEMKDLDFRLAAVEYSNLGLEWASATEEFKGVENGFTELHASLSGSEAAIQETRAEALSAEREVSTLQHSLHETESALGRAEHRVEIAKSQISSLTEQRERDQKDIEYLKQEMAQAAGHLTALEKESGSLAALLHDKNTVLLEKTVTFESLAKTLAEKEHELEHARTGVFNAMNETATEKSQASSLLARLSQLDEEEAVSIREAEDIEIKQNDLRSHIAEKEREVAEIAARRDALEKERALAAAGMEETLTSMKSLEAERDAAKDRQADRSSRLRSLLELEQSLEGYQKGVQTVMAVHKEAAAADRLGTIHGLVADIIETEPAYELAIEAVLGERLQYVVVGSHQDSLKAIDYLKTESGGRSTFVPEAPREIKSEPFVKNGHQGVIGPALSVVRCRDNYRSVAQYLLNDVVVVDTLDTALHLWNTNGFHKTLVTLSGEIVDPWGAVTGGMLEAGGTGLLRNRREIKDLELEVADLKKNITEISATIDSLEHNIESGKKRDDMLTQQIHAAAIDLVNGQKDHGTLKEERGRLDQRLHSIAAARNDRLVRRNELTEGIEKSDALLKSLEQGRTSAQENIDILQAELIRRREDLDMARAEITEVRVAITALQEKQDASLRNLDTLRQSITELEERIVKRENEFAAIASKRSELETAITEAEVEIRKYIQTTEEDRQTLVSRQEAQKEKAESLRASEEQARHLMHEIEAVQKQMSSNEVKRTELRMKIEHLKDSIRNSYHTDLESVVQDLGKFEINLDEAKPRIEELREKVDQMGPINIDALQEYNELKERYDLLTTQQKDINESTDNLKQTIAKLDGETTELFSEAFTAIHDKFKEVFSLLFDGGRAELLLLDESNILESGIEIIAQPRGKKFQSISLLSGGERALTAIALLFAAFLVKSSPFCLLDEVDAPLDEANITRFTRLVREMSSHSQFIVITHNKRTMETSDALYGITMEEPGSSRVVSVKLQEPAMA